MLGVNDLEGDEVLVESECVVKTDEERINVVEDVADMIDTAKSVSDVGENISAAEEIVSAASIPVSTAATTVSAASEIPTVTTADELTLAQALAELKSARPPTQGISFREPSEATTTTTTTTITAAPKPLQDKGKSIMIEEHVVEKEKSIKKQEQMRIDEELAFKLQAEEEERLAREKAQQVEEANIARDDVQAKIKVDYQLAQRLHAQEQEELTDEEKAKLFVQFLEQRRKHFVAKSAEEKRNKPPTRAEQRSIMCTYLKNMEGWKPKSLKNKSFANIQELFEKAIKRVNTFVDYKTELVEESSKKAEVEIAHESSLKRAGEEPEQESSKKQKLEEEKESEELKKCLEIVPDDGDDVTIDATPLSTKSPITVDYKIYKEGKKSYLQIIRAYGNSQIIVSSITAQQTKLDLELIPKEKRIDIGKCNGRLNPGKIQREPTFQVVLDALALTPCYFAFLITADVP
ncbi:hypothetical protein Tco_1056105 [Tanacetum coccineum]|uniref:Uncharacterized protein n=1 Tax=Tanacetum coccineum TaxID=301880 RepID=A0ABQ5H1K4_9ASTR